MTDATLAWTTMPSPLGALCLASRTDAHGPRAVMVAYEENAQHTLDRLATALGLIPQPAHRLPACPALEALHRHLLASFDGSPSPCTVGLELVGTPFQCEVWHALLDIPYGCTTTYAAVANRLGRPAGSARAVGSAVAANPLAIVVPCHRVVGADGALVGYAGGPHRKAWLLEHERTAAGGLFANAIGRRSPHGPGNTGPGHRGAGVTSERFSPAPPPRHGR